MSRWTHEAEHGDVLIVKDGDDAVSVYAHTEITADDLEDGEAICVFNLSPDAARDMAQWLVVYADAVENARRDPPERTPATAGAWWHGPPPVPETPTQDHRREALLVMVCTSPRNVTELGWYPPGMTMEAALKVHGEWTTWARAVMKKEPG